MRNYFTSVAMALLCVTFMTAQTSMAVSVSASVMGTLPSVLVESSGLDHTGGTHFWSLNDSGDPEIYRIASNGALTRTVTITNALNRNWEDIAHDAARNHMYIGDFGNNNCDRTNLRIFRIPYPSGVAANTIAAEKISFTYEDQERFPSPWMNFDVEAFVHFQGKLFLFTKADGNAIGYTKMYKLSDDPGTHVAELVDSFYTNNRTTGAAISPNGKSLVLISNTKIHLFHSYSGYDFFGGTHVKIDISGGWTQKEAVTFSSNNEIHMTDERTGGNNYLYYVDLSPWIPAPPPVITLSVGSISKDAVASVYPNPANEQVSIDFRTSLKNASISIFDMTGKMVFSTPVESNSHTFVISTGMLPTGVYFYRIFEEAKEVQTSRLVVSH